MPQPISDVPSRREGLAKSTFTMATERTVVVRLRRAESEAGAAVRRSCTLCRRTIAALDAG
jgi:hypothetical protein